MAVVKLRALNDEKEISAIPLTEPVLVQLEPEPTGVVGTEETPAIENEDVGTKTLREQLAASEEAAKRDREARVAAEQVASEARRVAKERETEAAQLRVDSASSQKDMLESSLAAAQAADTAAQQDYVRAYNEGNAADMAKAQSKIARAAAEVREFEGAISMLAQRKQEVPRQEAAPTLTDQINSRTDLLPEERSWLLAHPDAYAPGRLNRKLGVGYDEALEKGLSRGSPEYFKFLDSYMGYAKPVQNNGDSRDSANNEDATIMAAPVSREMVSSTGARLTNSQVELTSEQREFARSLHPNLAAGEAEKRYALQVLKLRMDKKDNPEKYGYR